MANESTPQRLPWPVWAAAGLVFVALVAIASRYGFHRDELYFIAAGRRLAWGYVDQPPLIPFIARIADLVPGAINPTVLRIAPAVSAAAVVVLAGLIARRFGGGRRAMTVAALFTAVGGFYLGVGHLLSTTTFDVLIWVAIILVVAGLVDGTSERWWLVIGALVGVGMLNKWTVVALVVALAIGLLATPQRTVLWSWWMLGGVGVAAVVAAPTIAWQAMNGWPQLEMAGALSGRDGPVDYVLIQIAILSLFLVIPAITGAIWLWRDEVGQRWRAFPIAFVVLFVVFLVTGGKGYYVAPLYVPLLAGGAIWYAGRAAATRRVVASLVAFGALIGFAMALPILPPSAVSAFNEVNGELGETYGWDQLVDQVSDVRTDVLTATGAEEVVIFTSNYGEAGAIEVLGEDLPQPVSGHNNYWLWGAPAGDGPIIGVGYTDAALRTICPGLERAGTITNDAALENDEFGLPLWVCEEPVGALSTIWDAVRHYE